MSTRYAVIKKTDDGEEEIIDIKLMEPGPPELQDEDSENPAVAEEIEDGPMIGMVRGGPVASVDGFGFREGDDRGTAALRNQETAQELRDRRQAVRDVETKRASREPSAEARKARAAPAKAPASRSAPKKG